MDLKNIISISGKSGLYNLVTTRDNGLIVEDLETGKRGFISIRKHQFTPLESIGIYTQADVVELADVFKKMQEADEKGDIPTPNSSGQEIIEFFRKIVPDYDEDRVFLSDMKKALKWYAFLAEKGLLKEKPVATDEEE